MKPPLPCPSERPCTPTAALGGPEGSLHEGQGLSRTGVFESVPYHHTGLSAGDSSAGIPGDLKLPDWSPPSTGVLSGEPKGETGSLASGALTALGRRGWPVEGLWRSQPGSGGVGSGATWTL